VQGERTGANQSVEYALNAVNQGVTSLGIKGTLASKYTTTEMIDR
jgi:hypothetical protein